MAMTYVIKKHICVLSILKKVFDQARHEKLLYNKLILMQNTYNS